MLHRPFQRSEARQEGKSEYDFSVCSIALFLFLFFFLSLFLFLLVAPFCSVGPFLLPCSRSTRALRGGLSAAAVPCVETRKGLSLAHGREVFIFRQPVSIFSRHNALIGRLALKSIDHRQSTRRLFVLFPPGPCCCLRQSLACLRCTIYELCTDKVFGRR